MKKDQNNRTALVLSGGGARGAYEAGVIHYITTVLAPETGIRPTFDIYCGSSVGAINTCYMASMAHDDPVKKGNTLYKTWKELKQDEIYARNLAALTSFIAKSTAGMALNIFRSSKRVPRTTDKHHFRGLFDTSPLPKFLTKHIDFKQLNANVTKGPVSAVSVTATNIATGYMELFVKKKKTLPYTGGYVFRETEIEYHHPLASGAIPVAFPPHKIGKYYYCDGGLRLNTPMSPAIQLGANRIFIIGLHNIAAREALVGSEIDVVYPPTLGQVMGKVAHSIFLDRIDYDMEQLTRINRIIEWGRMHYGADFLEQINAMLKTKRITGDIASRGLQDIRALNIFPSQDIAGIFAGCLSDPKSYVGFFGMLEKLVLRVLDVDLIQGRDFLSYLMFLPNYLVKLLELGFEDARTQRDKIAAFFASEG